MEISGFQPGESIAVFGAGPVGLMAAYSAVLRGASNVFVVDRVPERLAAAKKINAIPIDFSKGDAVEQIIKANGGEVDRSVDAVGYQAVGSGGNKEEPNIVLENMIKVTRACGGLGIPGLYVPRYAFNLADKEINYKLTTIIAIPVPQTLLLLRAWLASASASSSRRYVLYTKVH